MQKLTPETIAAIVDMVKNNASSHHQTHAWVISVALANLNRCIREDSEEIKLTYGTFTTDCIQAINCLHN